MDWDIGVGSKVVFYCVPLLLSPITITDRLEKDVGL